MERQRCSRCKKNKNAPLKSWARVAIFLVLLVAGCGLFADAQSPLVEVVATTLNPQASICALLEKGTLMACIHNLFVSGSTPDGFRMHLVTDLWSAPPRILTSLDPFPTVTVHETSAVGIGGTHRNFVLVATRSNLYAGTVAATPAIVGITRIVRANPQDAGGAAAAAAGSGNADNWPYFALLQGSAVTFVTEHRYLPGTLLVAGSINRAISACTLAGNTLIVIDQSFSLLKYTVSFSAIGRMTITGQVPVSFVQETPVRIQLTAYEETVPYLIRERGTPGSGGFREVFLWDGFVRSSTPEWRICEPETECGFGCIDCAENGEWVVLSNDFTTDFVSSCSFTAPSNAGVDFCAAYDRVKLRFVKQYCTTVVRATKFTPNCLLPKYHMSPPYVNLTMVSRSNLFDLPFAKAEFPALEKSFPLFLLSAGVQYTAASVSLVNDMVTVSAYRQGSACSSTDNRVVVIGAMSIPLCPGAYTNGMYHYYKQLSTFTFSLRTSESQRRVAAFQDTAYNANAQMGVTVTPPIHLRSSNAANSSIITVAANVAFSTTSTMPASSQSAVESLRGVTTAYTTMTTSAFGTSDYNDHYLINNKILTVVGDGGKVRMYRVLQRLGSSTVYYAFHILSSLYNFTEEQYVTCGTQVNARLYLHSAASSFPDGRVAPQLVSIANPPVFTPSAGVLDSEMTSEGTSGNGWRLLSFFLAPCTTAYAMDIRFTVAPSVPLTVTLNVLPSGSAGPPAGSPVAPPPPPHRTASASQTTTVTLTDATTRTESVTVASATQSVSAAAISASQSFLHSSTRDRSTRTQSLSGMTRTPQEITMEPTLSLAKIEFPLLPENATNWTVVPPPTQPFPIDPVAVLTQLRMRSPPPGTYVVIVALPFAGVGRLFVLRRQPSVAAGSVLRQFDDGTRLELRTTNATEALEFAETVAVAVNPEIVERNLTCCVPVNVTVWGEVIAAASSAVVDRSAWVYPLASLPLNQGPRLSPTLNCTRSVVRGNRFEVDIGEVFVHPLQVPLTTSFSGVGTPLPASLHTSCGFRGACVLRGVLNDDDRVRFRITASDGFFAMSALCSLQPVYVSLRVSRTMPLVFEVKAAAPVDVVIPIDKIFLSSLPITLLAVTLDSGFPLPTTLTFTQPNLLRGTVPGVELLALSALAVDLFSEVRFTFFLNSTNTRPNVTGEWEPVQVLAGKPFLAVRYIAHALSDPDPGDAVLLACVPRIETFPQWVVAATVSPGTLQFSGVAPVAGFPHSTNVTSALVCSDGVLTQSVTLVFAMQRAIVPRVLHELPTASAAAEEPWTLSLSVTDYFDDPTGGDVKFSTIEPQGSAVRWLQVQRASDVLVQLSGVPSVDDAGGGSQQALVLVSAVNAFGNQTRSTLVLTITASTWQLVLQYSALLYSAIGLIVSLLSLWFYWVPLVNTIMYGRRHLPSCPFATPGMYEVEPRGTIAASLHKNCAHVEAYVPMKHHVAGRIRRFVAVVACVSRYWTFLASHEVDMPPWLQVRKGDERLVFTSSPGDAKTPEVIVHERNVYGVILRVYTVNYHDTLLAAAQQCNGGALNIAVNDDSDEDMSAFDAMLTGTINAPQGGSSLLTSELRRSGAVLHEKPSQDEKRTLVEEQLDLVKRQVDDSIQRQVEQGVTPQLEQLKAMLRQLMAQGIATQHRPLEQHDVDAQMAQLSMLFPGNDSAGEAFGAGDRYVIGAPERMIDPLAELDDIIKKKPKR